MYRKLALVVTLLIAVCALSAVAEDLAGKVLQDHTGAPVASADVHVYKTGVRELAADLETDGEGRFQASGLAPGDYRLEVEKPSYLNSTSTVKIEPGSAPRLTIRLVRRGSISGRVTVAGGKSPSGALVLLLTKNRSGLRPVARIPGASSKLDENGRYRLFNLAPGDYAVAVSYGAHTSAVASTGNVPAATPIGSGFSIYPTNVHPEFFTITGGDDIRNVDLTIVTGALFSIGGKVDLADRKSAFWVALAPVDQPSLAVALTPAGDDGSFRFSGIPGGSYFIFATGPVRGRGFMGAVLGGEPLFARTRLEVIQDLAEVQLSPQKGIEAKVSLKPAPGAERVCPPTSAVRAMGLEDWGAMIDQTGPASRDKVAVLKNLAPARYELTATGLGDNCYQTGEAILDLFGGDVDRASISIAAAGSIHGKVAGAKGAELSVVLISIKTSEIRNTVPESDGRFSFATLPPGKYRIAADSSSSRWMANPKDMVEIEVAPGKPTEVELPAPQPAGPQH